MEYTGVWILEIILAQAALFAALCSSLAKKKGYHTGNYGILGFFLGIFGLLYTIGLPLSEEETRRRFSFLIDYAPEKRISAASEKASAPAEFSQIICPKCYERQSSGNSVCEACGAKMI
jgi:hypothetical protein